MQNIDYLRSQGLHTGFYGVAISEIPGSCNGQCNIENLFYCVLDVGASGAVVVRNFYNTNILVILGSMQCMWCCLIFTHLLLGTVQHWGLNYHQLVGEVSELLRENNVFKSQGYALIFYLKISLNISVAQGLTAIEDSSVPVGPIQKRILYDPFFIVIITSINL